MNFIDSVVSSINVFELMVFPNRMNELNFPKQQQTALDMLKDFMICTSITVTVHNDFFFGDGICNDGFDLAMFRYKKENKKM